MHKLDFSYVGSFQRGRFFDAERPVEEVWDQVAQLGIPAINESLSAGATPPVKKPWSEWGGYGTRAPGGGVPRCYKRVDRS